MSHRQACKLVLHPPVEVLLLFQPLQRSQRWQPQLLCINSDLVHARASMGAECQTDVHGKS